MKSLDVRKHKYILFYCLAGLGALAFFLAFGIGISAGFSWLTVWLSHHSFSTVYPIAFSAAMILLFIMALLGQKVKNSEPDYLIWEGKQPMRLLPPSGGNGVLLWAWLLNHAGNLIAVIAIFSLDSFRFGLRQLRKATELSTTPVDRLEMLINAIPPEGIDLFHLAQESGWPPERICRVLNLLHLVEYEVQENCLMVRLRNR